ncbi:hypothetical protein BDV93DRAFT_546783 [Ceratobasidium sp. AG-I]|nr:hypothetical protein BDV93DRAFT_546783 [Ceratobasidium sp. AG-I]
MPTNTYNSNFSRKSATAFIYPGGDRIPPTRRKLVAFVNDSINNYSSKFGAVIKRATGLLSVKKGKSKSKSKGSQGAQGEDPVLAGVIDTAEPVLSSGEVATLSSVLRSVKVDQVEGASDERAGALGRLVNAFHSGHGLDADEPDSDSDETESTAEQAHRRSASGVPIAFASGRYAAFSWPSPVDVSCFNHRRLGSDNSAKSTEHTPTSSAVNSPDARPVSAQGSSPNETTKAVVSNNQGPFFSRRPPSGEQSRQEIQEYTAASIKRPALKPLRLKTRARSFLSQPISELIKSLPERQVEIVSFEVPQPMSAAFADNLEHVIASPTWFSGDDESLSEDELVEVADCSLAFWGNIIGQAASNSHDQSDWPLNGVELQSVPARAIEIAHFAAPEPLLATVVGSQVSLGDHLCQPEVERRAACIAARSRDIITGPNGKRSSMVEWLKLIQSDGDDNKASSPPSSPESSLPTTPSSMFSPLPDFGGPFEHGFKENYAAYDSVISHSFNTGDNLISL